MGKEYNLEEPIWETEKWCIYSPSEGAQWHHHNGCSEPLKAWINSSGRDRYFSERTEMTSEHSSRVLGHSAPNVLSMKLKLHSTRP